MKIAREKVWADKEGNLVSDGDRSAVILVAAKGQEVPPAVIEKYQDRHFFVTKPAPVPKDKNPLHDPFLPENLLDTVNRLSGPGFAKLRSLLRGQFGTRLQSTGDGANLEQSHIIMQTLGASLTTPYMVTFDQIILDPFTGPGQFDLVERDSIRRVFDGTSEGGTPILGSETMNWQPGDADKLIQVGIDRWYKILSVEDNEHITLSGNITLPSINLRLTMEGETEVTLATKSGFTDGDTTGGHSNLVKAITADKVYRVDFVPGTAGDGIYMIRALEVQY